MMENQELYCHACERYVQFKMDISMNGEYEIRCPRCGHIHYRCVNNGKITDERWNSSVPAYVAQAQVSGYSITSSSTNTARTTINWTYASYGSASS